MFESAETQRRIGRFAWVMAWVGLVVGQLHALARHNTADGREDLHSALTRAWSDPARAALRPLLGDTPDRRRQTEAFSQLDAIMEIGKATPSAHAALLVLGVIGSRGGARQQTAILPQPHG